jgi:hypothetical protein
MGAAECRAVVEAVHWLRTGRTSTIPRIGSLEK